MAPEEEKEEILMDFEKVIKLDENKILKEGDIWNIISKEWIEQLKLFGNQVREIDNKKLLKDEELKKDIIEGKDYIFISNDLWKQLFEKFGGGPNIERKVILEGEKKICKIETHLCKIKMITTKKEKIDEKETIIYLSKKSLISEMKEIGLKLLNLENKEIRIWNLIDPNEPIILDTEKTIEESLIQDGQHILFETKNILDGNWIIKNEKKKNNFSESFSQFFKKFPSFSTNNTSTLKQKGNGLCGLNNLGNTCFMNSALQCLSNTSELTFYFLNENYKHDINKTNPLGMKGKLAITYGELIKKMWNGNSSSISPTQFKYVLSQFAPQFNGYRQHDSQELLSFLLDGLHEDLNLITKKPYLEIEDGDGNNDEKVSKSTWDYHLQRNKSIIVDNFHGQLKSTLICPDCKNISIKFDPFMYLSLPLSPIQLKEMTVLYLNEYSNERFTKYTIKIPYESKISILRKEFKKVLNNDNDELVFSDMNTNRIHSIMNDDQNISEIKSKEKILCFKKNKEYEKVMINICQKKKNDLCGIPMILFVEQKMKGIELYKEIRNIFDRFIIKEEEEEEEEETYFKLSIVSKLANSCGKCKIECSGCEIKYTDDEIELENGMNISINWNSIQYFNQKEAMTVDIHNSETTSKSSGGRYHLPLRDCLLKFSETEQLGENDPWYCPKCKDLKQAWKKFEIYSLPNLLIIHLKRFIFTKRYGQKLSTLVDFPIESFDMSEYVVGNKDKNTIYDLYAISNHSGSLYSGHYTADAKNTFNGNWYHFNDSSVSKTNVNSLVSSSAYVLFYQKRK
eukprot:gene4225-7562_t